VASQSWASEARKPGTETEDTDEETAGLKSNGKSDDIVIAKAHYRA